MRCKGGKERGLCGAVLVVREGWGRGKREEGDQLWVSFEREDWDGEAYFCVCSDSYCMVPEVTLPQSQPPTSNFLPWMK